MQEPWRIRTATETDLPALLALYRLLDEEMVALQPEFFCVAPRDETALRRELAHPDHAFFLAEQGGQAVGFAYVSYAGWTPDSGSILPHRYAELCDLAVAPQHRRRGVGTALIAAAKRWARDRRLEYLELNVLAQNSAAISLYEAHDFIDATRTMRCNL